jgi:diguanylate cyclase (GGDEF)-like protein
VVTGKAFLNENKRGKWFWGVVSLVLVAVIGLVDYVTSKDISMGLFYLSPISLVTWFISRPFGIAAAIVCTSLWAGTDMLTGLSYPSLGFYLWNIGVRLVSLMIVTLLLSALKKSLEKERTSSRMDYLTGAVNRRFFFDLTQMEIERLQRYKRPFTLIYFDLDNFKSVNDNQGHAQGDAALRTISDNARKCLRATDVFARLGGDEFAVLLPETAEQEAEIVAGKMAAILLDAMRENHWLVTFSIGVLTCQVPPATVDEIVNKADQLMYSVKNSGKDGIAYSVYAG